MRTHLYHSLPYILILIGLILAGGLVIYLRRRAAARRRIQERLECYFAKLPREKP